MIVRRALISTLALLLAACGNSKNIAPPSAPTIGTVTAGDRSATVAWTQPGSSGGSPITGYVITSDPDAVQAYAGGTSTSGIISGLTNGHDYTFTVAAVNAAGQGPASAP